MSRLQLAIYDLVSGVMLADWSHATDTAFTTNEHGYGTLTAFVRMSPAEAFRWYDRPGLPWVEVCGNGVQAWRGRLEDVRLVTGGIQISGLGAWSVFGDVPYTALWSDATLSHWRTLTGADSLAVPDRFVFDKQDRLYIAPRKGELHDPANDGSVGYEPPVGNARQLVAWDFDYELVASADWSVYADRHDDTWANLSTEWSLAGNGGTQTGSQTLTFTGCDRLVFTMHYTPGTANYTGETGAVYVAFTNIRVRTITTAVTGNEIVAGILAAARVDNPTQLHASTGLLQSPGIDLFTERYVDVDMRSLLTRLAGLQVWEVGVWEGGRVHFRPATGRSWYIDASDLDVERSLSQVWNSAYVRYGTTMTATATDTRSGNRYGVTRRRALTSGTTDSTEAVAERDAFLTDQSDPVPRASVPVTAVYTATGGRVPLSAVRSGDTLTLRSLPPEAGTNIDRIRSFRIRETHYACDTDTLEIVPEQPLPTLDVLLSQRAIGG